MDDIAEAIDPYLVHRYVKIYHSDRYHKYSFIYVN